MLQSRSLILFLSLCLLSGISSAQSADEKALARAQYLMRQLSAEKSALEAELAGLKKTFDEYKQEAEAKISKAERRESKLKAALAEWRESHENLKESLTETMTNFAKANRREELLEKNLAIQTENFDKCKDNNAELADISMKLLGSFNEKGFFDLIKKSEPVTGISRVSLEKYVQDTQYRIEDNDLSANSHQVEKLMPLPSKP